MYLLAQADPTEAGLKILKASVDLAQNTADSWNQVWESVINPDNVLWSGIIQLGLLIAALSILYLAMTQGVEIVQRQDWGGLPAMLVPPIVIAFFLGANGNLLADTVLLTRTYAYNRVNEVLEIQLIDTTFQQAINKLAITNAARQQIENLYYECTTKVGFEMQDCYREKYPIAQQIVADAEEQAGVLNALREFISNLSILSAEESLDLVLDPGQFLRDKTIPIIRTILWAVQWSFVNILEASLLLTALLSPLAFGASLIPIQGRPAIGWATSYISLFGVQLSYNILVGLIATIIVGSGGELISDLAFSFFVSLFAPVLALTLVGGGGIAIYRAISANVGSLKSLTSDLLTTVVRSSI
ncbi:MULTISPECIES: hypothetical protein [unclassified Coleofasciculus]|uniref:hypothetical protein n=1 Tax=unclassified Coleofasciculus TaxID=2692782 RepID=UPI001882E5CB|nr:MULTISPECIES: hypothetical protein [unclassified Coleofasciculus]MBE9124731.1 hypothetical protein [Coleofasciculus sp. LEGE 07081]MBE9148183.1 hypothetical protein [Coleofasciculus sp. LEGE 07092]